MSYKERKETEIQRQRERERGAIRPGGSPLAKLRRLLMNAVIGSVRLSLGRIASPRARLSRIRLLFPLANALYMQIRKRPLTLSLSLLSLCPLFRVSPSSSSSSCAYVWKCVLSGHRLYETTRLGVGAPSLYKQRLWYARPLQGMEKPPPPLRSGTWRETALKIKGSTLCATLLSSRVCGDIPLLEKDLFEQESSEFYNSVISSIHRWEEGLALSFSVLYFIRRVWRKQWRGSDPPSFKLNGEFLREERVSARKKKMERKEEGKGGEKCDNLIDREYESFESRLALSGRP